MTNKERAELIQNAIRDYKAAKESGDTQKIRNAVNDMENTFSAVCLWAVPGTEELRQMILSAKKDEARCIFCSYKRDLIRTAEISAGLRNSAITAFSMFASSPALTLWKWPQAFKMTALQSCLMTAASAQRQTPQTVQRSARPQGGPHNDNLF